MTNYTTLPVPFDPSTATVASESDFIAEAQRPEPARQVRSRKGKLCAWLPVVNAKPSVRRNDPCPCGSVGANMVMRYDGQDFIMTPARKKYKRCCMPIVPASALPERGFYAKVDR